MEFNITRKKEAQSLADNINIKEIVVIRAASESGQLYGSVSAKDIANEIPNAKLEIISGAGHLSNIEQPKMFNNVAPHLMGTIETFHCMRLNTPRIENPWIFQP